MYLVVFFQQVQAGLVDADVAFDPVQYSLISLWELVEEFLGFICDHGKLGLFEYFIQIFWHSLQYFCDGVSKNSRVLFSYKTGDMEHLGGVGHADSRLIDRLLSVYSLHKILLDITVEKNTCLLNQTSDFTHFPPRSKIYHV